ERVGIERPVAAVLASHEMPAIGAFGRWRKWPAQSLLGLLQREERRAEIVGDGQLPLRRVVEEDEHRPCARAGIVRRRGEGRRVLNLEAGGPDPHHTGADDDLGGIGDRPQVFAARRLEDGPNSKGYGGAESHLNEAGDSSALEPGKVT